MRWTTNTPPVSLKPPKSGLNPWAEGVNVVAKETGFDAVSYLSKRRRFAEKRVLLITGPTAAGKTTLAFRLRRRYLRKTYPPIKFVILSVVAWRPKRYRGERIISRPPEKLPDDLEYGVERLGVGRDRLAFVYHIMAGSVESPETLLSRILSGQVSREDYVLFRGLLETDLVAALDDGVLPILIVQPGIAPAFLDLLKNAVCVHLIIDKDEKKSRQIAKKRSKRRGLAPGDKERLATEPHGRLAIQPEDEWRYKVFENLPKPLPEAIEDEIVSFALQPMPAKVPK